MKYIIRCLFVFIVFSIFPSMSVSNYVPQEELPKRVLSVSPRGKDSNSGTIEKPFATLQHALNKASAGTTILLREGIYYETLTASHSGNPSDGYIKIMPFPGEHAILDGSKVRTKKESMALFQIDKKSYLHIEGLEFQNLNLEYARGIAILDGSHDIIIRNNIFHDLNTTKLKKDNFGGANAITVRSTHENLPIYNITIDSNSIYDCVLGFSEALVLSGNVKDFQVVHNTIQNVSNIGIDIAGHYNDYVGNPDTNQARRGLIEGNTVMGCKSDYGSGAASGIYVDGGRDLILSNNIVTASDYGITIGCERPNKTSSNILVSSNTVYKNDKAGFSIGGYKKEVGTVTDCQILSNKTYQNNLLGISYQGEITIKKSARIQVKDNFFYGSQIQSPHFSEDEKFYPIVYNNLPAEDISFENNVYFTKAGIENTYFRWNDIPYIGFLSYKEGSRLDNSSFFYDPLFVAPEKGDLSFTPYHPLIQVDGKNEDWKKQSSYVASSLPNFFTYADDNNLFLLYETNDMDSSVSVYLDTDGSALTGYRISKWQNGGIDYLVENGVLYKYTGNGITWSFDRIDRILSAQEGGKAEYQIPLSLMGVHSKEQIGIGTISQQKVLVPQFGLPLVHCLIP